MPESGRVITVHGPILILDYPIQVAFPRIVSVSRVHDSTFCRTVNMECFCTIYVPQTLIITKKISIYQALFATV